MMKGVCVTDVAESKTMVSNIYKVPNKFSSLLMPKIGSLNYGSITFSHIFREAKQSADALAKHGGGRCLGMKTIGALGREGHLLFVRGIWEVLRPIYRAKKSGLRIIISGSVRDHNSGGGACGGNEGDDESDNSND
ncbi:hypothetical protein JHK82_040462 [Glycine max]|nr:hypothetical protein JHK82_040462 [Glycine max]